MTPQEWAPIADLLFASYPMVHVGEKNVAAYYVALRDLTRDEVYDAVDECVRSCKWLPVPSELRAIARPPVPKLPNRYAHLPDYTLGRLGGGESHTLGSGRVAELLGSVGREMPALDEPDRQTFDPERNTTWEEVDTRD